MRYQYIDIIRWLCILLMVVFHLNYSLVHIFQIEFLNFSETFWYIMGRISAVGFMMIAWMSYFLASKKYVQQELQEKYLKYSWMLAIISFVITLGTYLFFPQQLILFGILHFFALSFAILPFVAIGIGRAGMVALWILAIFQFVPLTVEYIFLFPLGFTYDWFYSADYYPIIPYFAVVLLWFIVADMLVKYDVLKALHISRDLYPIEKFFSTMGKYSLSIYIIHQAIIIAIIYFLKEFVPLPFF